MKYVSILTLILAVLLTGCASNEVNDSNTKIGETPISNAPKPTGNLSEIDTIFYSRDYNIGDYEVRVVGKRGVAFEEYDDLNRMILTISKREEIVLVDTQLTAPIESIDFRDLDSDGLIEIYIISVGGSGGYEYIYMHEIEGEELMSGDIDQVSGTHNFYFTEDRLIHKQYLNKGCCDNLGLEFVYFKLVNNRFEFERRKEWMHSEGIPTKRRSFISED